MTNAIIPVTFECYLKNRTFLRSILQIDRLRTSIIRHVELHLDVFAQLDTQEKFNPDTCSSRSLETRVIIVKEGKPLLSSRNSIVPIDFIRGVLFSGRGLRHGKHINMLTFRPPGATQAGSHSPSWQVVQRLPLMANGSLGWITFSRREDQ